MICAAIPATAAVGAKLSADQLHRPVEERKPVSKMTGIVIALLVASSVVYHTLVWQNKDMNRGERDQGLALHV
jgi:hypothetical protein